MTLYTICVLDQPTVVMSAGVVPDREDSTVLDQKVVKALRDLDKRLAKFEPEVLRGADLMEIGAALDTWLGAELMTLEHDGRPLWSGDRAEIRIRDATIDEASKWHATLEDAVDEGEQDAGDNSWLVFLVSDLVDPMDAFGQEDDPD